MSKYVHVSFLLSKAMWKKMNHACINIDCFKGEWFRAAVAEKLKQDTDEQIAAMKKGKESP